VNIKLDNDIYSVVWFQHHKPGKGGAVVRLKLKNLRSGATIERTVRSGEKLEDISLERKKLQYLYNDGESFHFMDNSTYEQISVDKAYLGENVHFLQENMDVDILFYGEEIIGVQLPANVVLKVTYTEQGIKGDTVSGTMKPATVETGATLQVPLFVEEGDMIKIDTRTGEYIQRM